MRLPAVSFFDLSCGIDDTGSQLRYREYRIVVAVSRIQDHGCSFAADSDDQITGRERSASLKAGNSKYYGGHDGI